ncbi:hypothetical protein C8R43DRAFT_1128239 [Mycena crocata]|nr:hypothetical protein C8R43DRAFT_1128239 [Mycena crocata]
MPSLILFQDIALAVAGGADGLGAPSAESTYPRTSGTRLSPPQYLGNALTDLDGALRIKRRVGLLVLIWHLRSPFPTVELGSAQFPRLAPLKTPATVCYCALPAPDGALGIKR